MVSEKAVIYEYVKVSIVSQQKKYVKKRFGCYCS